MYANGEGVPQDYNEAFKWFSKAAEEGDSGAQRALGAMYENGYGVPKNSKKALKWYRKAEAQK